ncbi:Pheromone/general odorant binding protein superfamily [Gonioctena quinquepunctata]|nr:Pheromone/general odorant binding protein superfamily [Gonioctena quinquepunctata]
MDFPEDFKAKADEWHGICADITSVTDDQIVGMRHGDFPEDDLLKRYLLCIWRVSGVMDTNLRINATIIKGHLPKRLLDVNLHGLARRCIDETRSLDEEKYQIFSCWRNACMKETLKRS